MYYPVSRGGGSEDSLVARRALDPWNSRVVVLQMTGEEPWAVCRWALQGSWNGKVNVFGKV